MHLRDDPKISLFSGTGEVLNNIFLNSNFFLKYLSVLTRYANHNNPSMNDDIWYKEIGVHYYGVISIEVTDHRPCFIILWSNKNIEEGEQIKLFKLINGANTNSFLSAAQTFDGTGLFSEDVDVSYKNSIPMINTFPSQLTKLRSVQLKVK